MGKTYKALKEHYDFGTIIGGAYANLFAKLAEELGDGKKFRDIEDILNSIWATIPSSIKRRDYPQRGTVYWKKWEAVENQYKEDAGMDVKSKTERLKQRVWAKMQILSDLFFNQDIWVRTKIVDIFDEADYELYLDEGEANESQD